MIVALAAGFGVLGLALGSFATVLISRVPEKESVVKPVFSKCPKCSTRIRPKDNIPILSYLLLRGKCRTCGEKISPMYPLIEATVSILFVASGLHFPSLFVGLVFGLFFMVLVSVSVIDIRTKTIPSAIIFPAYGGFVALVAIGWWLGSLDGIRAGIGFAVYGAGVLLIWFVYPKGMGYGDVRLAGLIGLVVGSLGLGYVGVAAASAILLGGLSAIVAVATGRGRKFAIPFGPFLAAGAVIAAFFGGPISAWYLSTLGR